MKTSRRNALKWMGGSLFAALTPIMSYSHSATSAEFTGEEMYRGIFFAEGEFAKLIPEIKSLKAAYPVKHQTAEQIAHAAAVRRQIIQEIKQKDTLFFEQFKAAMTSQNVVKVQHSLILASTSTSAAVETLYGSAGKAAGQYTYAKESTNSVGTVLLIANAVALVNIIYILVSAVITHPEEEEMVSTKKSSALLIEQIAMSVCYATRNHA